MKSSVTNCSAIDDTASSLIALISIKLYNLPPTKAVKMKKKNTKTSHYWIVSYLNDGCVPAMKSQILQNITKYISIKLSYHQSLYPCVFFC